MPNGCCVVGCTNHAFKDKKSNTQRSYYLIPAVKTNQGNHVREITERRRHAWIAQLGRSDVTFRHLKDHHRVCSDHFVKGKPAYEMKVNDPDWIPTLNLGRHEVVGKRKVPLEKIKIGKKVTERTEIQPRVSKRIKTRQKMLSSKQTKNQERASKRTKTQGRLSSQKKTERGVAKARKKNQEFEIVIENDQDSVLDSVAGGQNTVGTGGDVLLDCAVKQEVFDGDCAVKQEVFEFDGNCVVKQEVFGSDCVVKQEVFGSDCVVKQEVLGGDCVVRPEVFRGDCAVKQEVFDDDSDYEFIPVHFESNAIGVYSRAETLGTQTETLGTRTETLGTRTETLGTQTDLTAEDILRKHSELDRLLKENTRLMRQLAKKGGMVVSTLSDSIDKRTNNFEYDSKVKMEPQSDW